MGPAVRTYGGYKPKRRGLPKHIVEETLETTGNIFSAFHIDNLKMLRADDNLKQRATKVTKTTTVRNFKPTYDDSLDSTFDKLAKASKTEENNFYNLGVKKDLDSSKQCWTCLQIPTTTMAYHVLYECKEDSYYSNSPKTQKLVKQKIGAVKKSIHKEKRKKLTLRKSPVPKSLKQSPPKDAAKLEPFKVPVFTVESPAQLSSKISPFSTPKVKSSLLGVKSPIGITSTPMWNDQRPKFSWKTSPIQLEVHDKDDIGSQQSFSKNKFVPFNLQDAFKPKGNTIITKDNSFDNLRVEMKKNVMTMRDPKVNSSESCCIMECSIINSPQKPRPSGYITKRRMWRKTRRTDFHSHDMFKSTIESVDNHSNCSNGASTDMLQGVTSRKDKSCHSVEEKSFFYDIKEERCEVISVKKDINCADSQFTKNEIHDKADELNSVHLDKSLDINELSREFQVRLSLLQCININARSSSNSKSVDIFEMSSENCTRVTDSPKLSGLSRDIEVQFSLVQNEKFHSRSFQSGQSVDIFAVSKDCNNQMDINLSVPLESINMSVNLSHSLEHNSVKNLPVQLASSAMDLSLRDISNVSVSKKSSDVSEIVLKPCFVKLHRYDSQTVADITFSSKCDISDREKDFETVASNSEVLHINQFEKSSNVDLETVVSVPLSVLGKLDKITVRSSSKISQSSLQSIVQGEKFNQTVNQLWDIQTESREEASQLFAEEENIDKNAKDFQEVLSRCGQTEPLPFSTCYPESMFAKCKKIGEGAYGEVFLYDGEKQKTVIKIIPIEGDIEINAAVQKKFWEIKPEVIVAQELSSLRKSKNGTNCCDIFNEVLGVRCVRGKYPQWMLDLWHTYDEQQGSENDCPDVFGDDQLYITLELAHGGQDLESFQFTTAEQAVAAITQIVFALAVGESEIQFEHRDLHWGNVLVAPSKAKAVPFTLEGKKYKVPTKGIKVSVIDFTMSRMTMPSSGENMFYDFGHDEELFAAQGDYQCDIYRLMRERTRNNWSVFEPFTNILWLHYLLDKMCSMVEYRNQTTKAHQQAMGKLENLRDTVLAYSSATTFASSDLFKSSRLR